MFLPVPFFCENNVFLLVVFFGKYSHVIQTLYHQKYLVKVLAIPNSWRIKYMTKQKHFVEIKLFIVRILKSSVA